jgi:hypothetical protein
MCAWPGCGMIGCGGNGPGQPTGLAVTGGHRFGGEGRANVCGCSVGAASGCGVALVTARAADGVEPLGLEVAAGPRPACDVDVQAAVSRPISRTALSVACLVMVIGI